MHELGCAARRSESDVFEGEKVEAVKRTCGSVLPHCQIVLLDPPPPPLCLSTKYNHA